MDNDKPYFRPFRNRAATRLRTSSAGIILAFPDSNVIHPLLDLRRPRLFDALFGWPVIEAGNQPIDQQTTVPSGQGQRLFEYLGNFGASSVP